MYSEELRHYALTDSAKRILEHSLLRAIDRGVLHDIGQTTLPTLIVWSILRWERKVGLAALEKLGTNLETLAGDIDKTLTISCRVVRDQATNSSGENLPIEKERPKIDAVALFEPLLKAAQGEATILGHAYIGTEHLLLAAIELADERLRGDLTRHHIDAVQLRHKVIELLPF